ncbi:transaldolase family protein [Catenulispora subtropica]|uniref:Transaldolase n=1 Tax=Catenulispora subtropica TaxID=450798 RepID=A0ABN2T8V7_9ACTN
MRTALQQLADHGQSPWIHYLARDWILDDRHGLPRLVRSGVSGAVANPAALATALAHTSAYDAQIRTLVPLLDDAEDIRRQLVRVDAQQACDLLLETAEGTRPLNGWGPMDGWVGVEVDPHCAADPAATVSQAQRLADAVARPNLLVGITAGEAGPTAIEEATARGLSVMATAVYSPGRYRETALAYRRGVERLLNAGGDPGTVSSVASVPMSALDEKADLRLRCVGEHPELVGTLALATAKLIRAEYLSVFSGDSWSRLAAQGATPQRCLWSSLTVTDGRQSDVRYVEELVGPDTVALLSPHTAEAFLAGGRVRATLDLRVPAARRTLAAHVRAGVSPKMIVDALERENVRRGVEAFRDVRAVIDDKRALLGTGAALRW